MDSEGRRYDFQLKRIGKLSTIAEVKDVLKINKSVTKFGRHSGNDFYLDSTHLVHFISRWHSEIERDETEDGTYEYFISDKSLNGTYVNEVRVSERVRLADQDIVVFGHINGKNIRPGEFARQSESEFHFKFEQFLGSVSPVQDAEPGETTFLPSPSQSPTQESNIVLKDISNTGDALVDSRTGSHNTSREDTEHDSTNPAFMNASTTSATLPGTAGTLQVNSVTSSAGSTSRGGSRKHRNKTSPSKAPAPPVVSSDEDSDDSAQEEEEEEDEDSAVGVVALPIETAPPPPSTKQVKAASRGSGRGRGGGRGASRGSIDRGSARPAPLPKTPQPRAKTTAKSPSSTAPVAEPSTAQPHPAKRKSDVMRGGPTKKPTKSKKTKTNSTDESDSDPDDNNRTWHEVTEACAAFDCKRPAEDKVSWVACDDCDQWYHTACVNCSLDEVQDDNAQFHCGCT